MPFRAHPAQVWKLAALAALAALWRSTPAAACLALPQTYTLDGAYPAPDASNVPINAPLVLRTVAPPPGAIGDGALFSTSTLLRDAASDVVQVVPLVLGPRDAQVFSFVPAQPLQPHTIYIVDLGRPPPTAGAAAAPPSVTWQFTTGDAPAAALRLKGDVSISYEAGTDPHYDCSAVQSLCGACPIDKQVNVTKARVELPASFDGFSALAVQATLRVFEPVAEGETGVSMEIQPAITAGQVGEALVTMPLRDNGMTYAPCFEFEVADASGVRTSQLRCLDATFPLPEVVTTGAAGATSDTAIGGNTDSNDNSASNDNGQAGPAQRPHTSTACSFASPESGAGTGIWLLGVLLLKRWRRQRMGSIQMIGHASQSD